MYSLYDGLLGSFDFIEKINLDTTFNIVKTTGYDVEDYPIYMYKFSTPFVEPSAISKRIKVLITSATHPTEYTAIASIYNLMSKVCNSWNSKGC